MIKIFKPKFQTTFLLKDTGGFVQFGLELIDVFESVGNIRAFMQVFWLAVGKIPGNVHMIIDKFAFNSNFLGAQIQSLSCL